MLKKIRRNYFNKAIIYILIINIIVRIASYSLSDKYVLYDDSYSYINFPFREFFNLNFISGRTPGYAAIIRLFNYIDSHNYLYLVALFQIIVSIISIYFFYKALELVVKNKLIIIIFTILYSSSNAIIGWDKVILTESLSISGTVIFIYLLLSYLKKPTKKLAICIPIYTLVLIMIRPTFLLYFCIIAVFWILRWIYNKEERYIINKAFLSIISCAFIIITYSYIFSLNHGVFSLSDAKVRQDLFVVIQEEYYRDASDKEFIEYVDKSRVENPVAWTAMMTVLHKYGNEKIADINKEVKTKNIKEFVSYLFNLADDYYNVEFTGYDILKGYDEKNKTFIELTGEKFNDTFIKIKFYHIYFVIVIELIILIISFIKYKNINWLHGGLFAFTAGILVSTFIATCGEFMRTSITVLPFAYISIAIYFSKGIEFSNIIESNK